MLKLLRGVAGRLLATKAEGLRCHLDLAHGFKSLDTCESEGSSDGNFRAILEILRDLSHRAAFLAKKSILNLSSEGLGIIKRFLIHICARSQIAAFYISKNLLNCIVKNWLFSIGGPA